MSARVYSIADAYAERARDCRVQAYVANAEGKFAEADTALARNRRLEECVAFARRGLRVVRNEAAQ